MPILFRTSDKLNHYTNAEKLARLKQAKEEADKEIAEFRAQVEAEFQKKIVAVTKTYTHFLIKKYILT